MSKTNKTSRVRVLPALRGQPNSILLHRRGDNVHMHAPRDTVMEGNVVSGTSSLTVTAEIELV